MECCFFHNFILHRLVFCPLLARTSEARCPAIYFTCPVWAPCWQQEKLLPWKTFLLFVWPAMPMCHTTHLDKVCAGLVLDLASSRSKCPLGFTRNKISSPKKLSKVRMNNRNFCAARRNLSASQFAELKRT